MLRWVAVQGAPLLVAQWRCQDLAASGAPIARILEAGQWRSAAFMLYLKEADLERVCRRVRALLFRAGGVHGVLAHRTWRLKWHVSQMTRNGLINSCVAGQYLQ